MMERLFYSQINSSQKKLVKISKGEHNDTWLQKGYMKSIKEFCLLIKKE